MMLAESMRSRCGLALLLLAFSPIARTQDTTSAPVNPRAYVLDSAGRVVTAVDILKGQSLASAPVSGHATKGVKWVSDNEARIDTLLLTADGARLVRIDSGEEKMTFRYGMHPLERSTLAILDADTLQAVAHVDLGWGLTSYQLTPNGKTLVAILSGYQSNKPAEALPSELVAVDLVKGQVTARAELARQPVALLLSPDGATAAVFYGSVSWKNESMRADEMPYSNAELQFFDMAALSPLGQLTFDGSIKAPVPSPAGDYLYLIDKGQPSNKPEKNTNGRIHVISLQERKETALLDAGANPGGIFSDTESGQLILLSNGIPVKGEKQVDGEVRVLRGASIASLLKVASAPQFVRVSPDRKRLYIVCQNAITVLDHSTLGELGRIALNGWASDLAFDPQGKLGFVLHPESSQLTILELDAMRQMASVTTGRAGVKFAKALGAVALTAASATAAYGQA